MASQAVAERRPASPIQVLRDNLTQMQPELKMALPQHVTVEKFSRVAMTAIQNNPDLLNCDRKSLFGAIVRLAQDGLLPDGREAALVKFGQQVQAMPMIAGVLKKIRQSGDVSKVSAQVVYENDHFVVKYGFDEDVEHSPPALDKERGKPIGAYATAVLKDGSRLLEVMSLEEIEKVRNVSRAKGNGPWVSWWGEMARKTVMRRLSKRLPMSTDRDDDVFERDETMKHIEAPAQVIDAEAPVSRLDMIEQQIADDRADTITEESPAAEEGRTDEDHGDQHDGTNAEAAE
ncbi:recombinase RecT [Sphingopyxis terrae]|uniref:recombinase RecT n=1 Tax=Sphingopyxis terrae TaxID=33052 RepID=UPI0009EE6A0D|nr:recombinase RecT [Sphingopyxis terrae]